MVTRPGVIRSPIRKTIDGLSYGVFLIAAVIGMVYFIFWMPFVSELRKRNVPKSDRLEAVEHADLQLLNRLGSVKTQKTSSFVHFPQEKQPEPTVEVTRSRPAEADLKVSTEHVESESSPEIVADLAGEGSFDGNTLKAIREARHVSLETIVRTTKIRKQHLENIESGRYAALPAPVYLRGFLRQYALCLKLDPVIVATEYLKHYSQWAESEGPKERGWIR